MSDHVWYVAYGSNLNTERLMCYFTGHCYKGLTQSAPCANQSAPLQAVPVEIPHDIYFAKYSSRWGGAVAFLDDTQPGFSYCMAYLVTAEQFEHLYREENGGSFGGDGWYTKLVELGTKDGYPMKTFTNSCRLEANKATEVYLGVIKDGIMEHYPNLTEEQVDAYLQEKNGGAR